MALCSTVTSSKGREHLTVYLPRFYPFQLFMYGSRPAFSEYFFSPALRRL